MYKYSLSLHDKTGQRKYLNQKERLRFLEVTKQQLIEVKLFCQLIFYTGARISEIHNLKKDSIDLSNGTVVVETLKKRQKGIFREIPIPDYLLKDLKCFIDGLKPEESLWWFSLRTASRRIKDCMEAANIKGVRSSAKGLRHGFAVHAVSTVPLTLVKKWLGHSRLETTEIYLDIVGVEERDIARRFWEF
ncbi:MAG: site-specific integrase [Cytophagales bacterium]|nr:site-specific integrase [Cytophagales bacterium]